MPTHAQSTVVVGRPFLKTPASAYVCQVWFERDRSNIRLESPNGRVIFDLWDEAVEAAITDGFLTPPRRPRATSADWQPAAVQFAVDTGLLTL
jgi:hypothetical protein